MTEIKSTIDYTLTIDPKGENHQLQCDATMENSIVGLLMTERILAIQIEMWVEKNKEVPPGERKTIQRTIQNLRSAVNGIRPLSNALLDTYFGFKEYESQVAEDRLKKEALLPKQIND